LCPLPFLDGGGALVNVAAADHQVDQVLELMERYTPEDLAGFCRTVRLLGQNRETEYQKFHA
jgi:hypothetical protein